MKREVLVFIFDDSAALKFAKEILLLFKAKPEETVLEWYNLHKSGFYPVMHEK